MKRRSNEDRLDDMAANEPLTANAIATIMIWRLLRAIAAILATIMLALVVIAIHVL